MIFIQCWQSRGVVLVGVATAVWVWLTRQWSYPVVHTRTDHTPTITITTTKRYIQYQCVMSKIGYLVH